MPRTKKQPPLPLNERERYVLDHLISRPDGFPSSELIDLTSQAFGCDARSVRRTLFSLREDRKLARYSGETKGRLWFAIGSPPSDVRPSTDHAIALLTLRQLAQRHLPAGVIGALADDFAGAAHVLGAHPTDSNLAAARQWLGKTARLNAGHALIAPDIDEALFQTIGRALYDDHTLDIHYKSYNESAPGRYVTRKHRILPYALIEKGPLWYLVAKIKGKEDNTALRLDRIRSAAPVGADGVPGADPGRGRAAGTGGQTRACLSLAQARRQSDR
ncbi:WYL domain-containing protein [Cupriavidus taiwanensis]|uniref:WYL domain-containing protein n=1 Tax=Cupriavidus taiwanensis TaxID=164546 RepID=A0A7Z7JFC8_9BURK|nr:WYL domain-containing protein [Cupriavidus taiwanensis]SOZ17169.1 conserved hypothetical protein [Cupriavidus taiwanensis]SOZ96521.1 conserved hypothetical protein [Cupriavidus taiwanensis]SPC25552.1 conserved hypothetical protein [Cupriavidus taiwanensis]